MGQDLVGSNSFVYCSNNPINYFDKNGEWTVSIGANVNLTVLLGWSATVMLTFDSEGMHLQTTKSGIGCGDPYALTAGLLDLGAGIVFGFTNAESANDLLDIGAAYGLSVGDGFYVGADLITNTGALAPRTSTASGLQMCAGFGVGIDAHIAQTTTTTHRTWTWSELSHKTVVKNNYKIKNVKTIAKSNKKNTYSNARL